MKMIVSQMLVVVALMGVVILAACETSQPGVKSTVRSQWATVHAAPPKAAEVAADVLQELQLKNVESKSTAVDGLITGFTADETKISVSIERAGPSSSEVTVTVGAFGDQSLGSDILGRMQNKISPE